MAQRVGWRPKDFASIVQSPRRVSQVYETLNKLESGELQLRVRALELERAMVRNSVMQRASLFSIAACCAVNVATVLVATVSTPRHHECHPFTTSPAQEGKGESDW